MKNISLERFFFFKLTCVPVYGCVHVSTGSSEVQKGAADALELES